jgi:hypothetical protein
LTPDEASSLHGSLVLDAMERAKSLSEISVYVAGTPDLSHPFFKVMEGRYDARLIEQRGETLGDRMRHALEDVFTQRHSPVLLTGTDLPSLPRNHFRQALNLLTNHDVVLGPTVDGGYYLIGLRHAAPELFREISWSTPHVLEDTRRKAMEHGLSVALLPASRDLDSVDDLQVFIGLAGKDKQISKRTEGALKLIAKRLRERGVVK